MTQKKLIEKAVISFVGLVSWSNVIAKLNEQREWLAPWVVKVLDSDVPGDVIVTTILFSLFEDCVAEVGETIAMRSTGVWMEDIGAPDPYGDVLGVSERRGHVWIRYRFSDNPLADIEISMMDNDR